MELFDKQIHRDEFKLRLLMTDGCNRSCPFCLNDFQQKPFPNAFKFLDTGIAATGITAYSMLKGTTPKQVYFSGGEPTLHRDLDLLINLALGVNCRVTLNTNGSFSDSLIPTLRNVHNIHFGVYEKSRALRLLISNLHGTIQCVYSKAYPYVNEDFIDFYTQYPWNIPVKVFGDLKETHEEYRAFANFIVERFKGANLTFRYTGVQENRGIGCNDCDRYCVTLKGAWVFPDGRISHCPQKWKGRIYNPGTHGIKWRDALEYIQKIHDIQRWLDENKR